MSSRILQRPYRSDFLTFLEATSRVSLEWGKLKYQKWKVMDRRSLWIDYLSLFFSFLNFVSEQLPSAMNSKILSKVIKFDGTDVLLDLYVIIFT